MLANRLCLHRVRHWTGKTSPKLTACIRLSLRTGGSGCSSSSESTKASTDPCGAEEARSRCKPRKRARTRLWVIQASRYSCHNWSKARPRHEWACLAAWSAVSFQKPSHPSRSPGDRSMAWPGICCTCTKPEGSPVSTSAISAHRSSCVSKSATCPPVKSRSKPPAA